MSEPRTKAGQKMLYDMGLDDPIVGKHRRDTAIRRIRAIEAEAAAPDTALDVERLAEAVMRSEAGRLWLRGEMHRTIAATIAREYAALEAER